MDTSEVIAAIGGPGGAIVQPEGGSEAQTLNPLGLARTGAEEAPPNVEPQQGAGGAGYLTPGAQGQAADGTVEPGYADHYSSQGGPELLSPSSGLAALTPDPSNARPAGSADPAGAPVGRPDHMLGRNQGEGQGLNPMLKPANAPRSSGLFGKPGV